MVLQSYELFKNTALKGRINLPEKWSGITYHAEVSGLMSLCHLSLSDTVTQVMQSVVGIAGFSSSKVGAECFLASVYFGTCEAF